MGQLRFNIGERVYVILGFLTARSEFVTQPSNSLLQIGVTSVGVRRDQVAIIPLLGLSGHLMQHERLLMTGFLHQGASLLGTLHLGQLSGLQFYHLLVQGGSFQDLLLVELDLLG
jgi:hypothetical protein